MKLYLSSYRIPTPEDVFNLVGKDPEEISTGIIINAKDYRSDREKKLHDLAKDLGAIGFTRLAYLDLRDYEQPDTLQAELERYDMLYVCGGNSFNLRNAMSRSGFDDVIEKVLRNGVVYLGESAGGVVAGPTLKGFERADSLDEVQDKIIWEGLNLLDKVVIPHADSIRYKDRVVPIVKMYPEAIVLNDNQAYVVDGDQTRLVTGITNA